MADGEFQVVNGGHIRRIGHRHRQPPVFFVEFDGQREIFFGFFLRQKFQHVMRNLPVLHAQIWHPQELRHPRAKRLFRKFSQRDQLLSQRAALLLLLLFRLL